MVRPATRAHATGSQDPKGTDNPNGATRTEFPDRTRGRCGGMSVGASKLKSLIYWNCIHISPLGKVTWKIAP